MRKTLLSLATALDLLAFGFGTPYAATDFGQSDGVTDAGNSYHFYSSESASVSPTGQGMIDPRAWAVSCKTDAMTDKRTCRVMDSGILILLASGGQVDGLCIMGHDFPGMKPMIRINELAAVTLPEHACVVGAEAAALVAKFQAGTLVRTRAFKWPYKIAVDQAVTLTTTYSDALELAKVIFARSPSGPN